MSKFLVCLVIAFWSPSASAQSGQMKNVTVESEIAALEQSWAAAQKANDPSAIGKRTGCTVLTEVYPRRLRAARKVNETGGLISSV